MIAIPIDTVENIIKLFDSDIKRQKTNIKVALTALSKDGTIRGLNKLYVIKLLSLSENIITAKPSTLLRYKNQFNAIITPENMKMKSRENFRKKLLKALGYSQRRSDFYPKYFHKIGIKACIYCNSQLTVAIEKEKKLKTKTSFIYKAKFQVDHFLPKSHFPCFSVSLFNLYPVCSSCNNSKSINEVDFQLYLPSTKDFTSKLNFKLERGSMAQYLLNRKLDNIKFTFEEPNVKPPLKRFQDAFDIKGIYDTQKDLIEELILKGEVYTSDYKGVLKKKFPKLFTTPDIINRILIGNYTSDADIHKRPMAKFTLDIAKQVGLIKK